jgi:hypothetical protein
MSKPHGVKTTRIGGVKMTQLQDIIRRDISRKVVSYCGDDCNFTLYVQAPHGDYYMRGPEEGTSQLDVILDRIERSAPADCIEALISARCYAHASDEIDRTPALLRIRQILAALLEEVDKDLENSAELSGVVARND